MARTILPSFIGKPAVATAQKICNLLGFDLVDNRPPQPIVDAQYYRPTFFPWLTPDWAGKLRADDENSALPLERRYTLYVLARDAMLRCGGNLAECGVYKGGTAKILKELCPDNHLYLFDTFSGMPETNPTIDLHRKGDFSDTTPDNVKSYVGESPYTHFIPGLIPQSLGAVSDQQFSFVHIDLDIYSAIKGATEFFYPRLTPHGILLFDDYGFPSCPGARMAIDEFFSDKPEALHVLSTGQAVARKL